LIIYPASPAKGGIAINTEDYKCLGTNEFLNDSVIDFYLKYLKHEVLGARDRHRTHIFSSHFYTRLAKPYTSSTSPTSDMSITRQRYAGVQRWTKDINIFEKDFVVVPINEQ
jgi:sentrin-specific protease 7